MNNITLNDATRCPICSSEEVTLTGIQPLFEDTRFDYCRCNNCGAEWRFYYKVSDCNIELTKEGVVPTNSETFSENMPSEEPTLDLKPDIESVVETPPESSVESAEYIS